MASVAKNLGATLGGIWKYDGICTWYCDDKKRRISRCSAGVDEFDNEVGPAQYWLYEDGKTPKRAEEFMRQPLSTFRLGT